MRACVGKACPLIAGIVNATRRCAGVIKNPFLKNLSLNNGLIHRWRWSELFVVYELVKSNARGGQMFKLGWIRKADEKRFRITANSRTALGRDARHGRDSGQTPSNPMTQPEAITIIRALAAGWLRHIAV